MTPEFSRPERIETIGERARDVRIDATAEERRKLAGRFRLIAIDRLEATLSVARGADHYVVTGRVIGDVVQACTATGDPVRAAIDEPVELRFVEALGAGEELELDEHALDTIPFDGGAIDLGEAAAQTLALALDPFPRSERADEILQEAGVRGEEEAGPFSALTELKARLERRK